ncbi:hypothetical protein Pta02_41980 [Planobispora takensis]|uniref:Uncharacterized protein n=2 Tax=Planobispora TaxID=29298 RepID=A0A8J3T1D6_9ACTN|nr:hypothetical protein Psi01_15100 [Planobispora siamensis]GII02190.1 hypothetical protein Pta02_41980 [Planobispora takensis]
MEVPLVDEVDQKLTQPGRGVDIDLALDLDDGETVLGMVVQLQIHRSSSAFLRSTDSGVTSGTLRSHDDKPRRAAFNHAYAQCLYEITIPGDSAQRYETENQ